MTDYEMRKIAKMQAMYLAEALKTDDELMDLVMDGANFGYWLKRGKKKSLWHRMKQTLKQQIRIYPYMPREVRTEMWLGVIGKLKV